MKPAFHSLLEQACILILPFLIIGPGALPAASQEAALFSGMGPHKWNISTASPEAQKWFNQGLNWYYAFNFDEAKIAFGKAAAIDPNCPMAWWGLSEAAGPQYNHAAMDEERTMTARKAMDQALAVLDQASPMEQKLIKALEIRNALEIPDDDEQVERNKQYAAALGEVWKAHPNVPDIGALYANARMVVRPWNLYDTTRKPFGDTLEIRNIIEQVLAIAPHHPGALHLYIHVVEPSTNPRAALSVARRLDNLVPASGHLRHMPTHIYIQTGHWDRAVVQNADAMGADVAYRSRAPGRIGQTGYQVHNAHMLVFAATMSARRSEAMAAARAMWAMWEDLPEDAPKEKLKLEAGYIDTLMCAVYDVHKRFGDWKAILNEPEPPRAEFFPITRALRHAARAVAYANLREFGKAREELTTFKNLIDTLPEDHLFGADKADQVMTVSLHFVEGEIALNEEKWGEAARHLEKAIEIEDELRYTEPPQYLQPTRHALGAVFLKAGKPGKAAAIYRRDLKEWPNNVWSLYGLGEALERQGKMEGAARVKRQLGNATAFSDFPVDSSCLCLRNM